MKHLRLVLRFPGLLVLLLAGSLQAQRAPDPRDHWQRPNEVMDALRLKQGSRVADVGAGEGYFTFRLADRVGPQGHVYAVDINSSDVDEIRQEAGKEHLTQIEAVLGATDDPRLPPDSLDAVLVVNAYHEMRQYDTMLSAMLHSLKPGGLLGIIDKQVAAGRPRNSYYGDHRIPRELVLEDAARNGFRFVGERPGFVREDDRTKWYFLLFERPVSH